MPKLISRSAIFLLPIIVVAIAIFGSAMYGKAVVEKRFTSNGDPKSWCKAKWFSLSFSDLDVAGTRHRGIYYIYTIDVIQRDDTGHEIEDSFSVHLRVVPGFGQITIPNDGGM